MCGMTYSNGSVRTGVCVPVKAHCRVGGKWCGNRRLEKDQSGGNFLAAMTIWGDAQTNSLKAVE